MSTPRYQLIGRRADQPQILLFRDTRGRHFLRAACGAPLVRITRRDAETLMRHYRYRPILDPDWRSEDEIAALECVVPVPPLDEALGMERATGEV